MQKVVIIALLMGSSVLAAEPAVQGTGNNVNICQPKIVVNASPCCNKAVKPKVIVKKVEVEKIVTKEVIKEVPVVVERTVEVVKEVKKIKHHILTLFVHKTVTDLDAQTTGNTGTARVTISPIPGLMYQYQFDSGLVPMVGLDVTGRPIGGIGVEF